jgi:hypothetical protein
MHEHEFELICDVEVCGPCYTEELMNAKLIFIAPKFRVSEWDQHSGTYKDKYLTRKEYEAYKNA